ncbi:VWA domain-containing protein [Leptonema illini]|nr:VWA domain-containing protein [Leptonema illini]
MITHRYGPYEPGPDPEGWNTDRLMSILSELLMKHDIALEDALNELISRGLPVNLFLKEGGMDDLLGGFIKQIEKQQSELLERYRLDGALGDTDRDVDREGKGVLEQLKTGKDASRKSEFEQALSDRSHDRIFQMKWDLVKDQQIRHRDYNALLKALEDRNRIDGAMRRFPFRGTEDVNRKTAIEIIDALEQLEELRKNLQTAMQNGDLFQFNLERLAELLGPESYEEFLERRQRIFDHLAELLEKQGQIVRDEAGELQLSPESIRRIGRRALEEIFRNLKQDDSGGSLISPEESDGEQITPISRSYEMGDNISNLDPAASIINAVIRTGQPRPGFRDLEIFRSRGQAKSATAVLLDMSGSMQRSDRFYNAKKMVLALESLIRDEYREDRLLIVGFGTTAQVYRPSDIPSLQPFPVTIFDPHIRLRFDMAARSLQQKKDPYQGIPLYFTNLQRGLALCRQLLGGKETKNKQIILITDGVPTAHFEENKLHINYPPSPADFDFALKEARACTEAGISINTFLLTPEWGFTFFDERPFVEEFVKNTQGRVFYPHPSKLDHFVLVDFIEGKKRLIS